MKSELRLFICDNGGQRFFGAGPYELLRGISQSGSLRAAAAAMNLSYSKALVMLRRAERALGTALTRRVIGGKNGGGSCLTEEAQTLLHRYERYLAVCVDFAAQQFESFMGDAADTKT